MSTKLQRAPLYNLMVTLMVVGRKNHYRSRSKRGIEVAALFYSLSESAKLCGIEPKAYLLQATRAALANRDTITLPHELLTASPEV